jgi:excisionase family DNA binding protein
MITVPDAARRVGRNPETIRRWIRSGRLSATRIGTQLFIEEGALQAIAGSTKVVTEQSAPYGEARTEVPSARGGPRTILVDLDEAHASRLQELAARIHLSAEVVAGSLLSSAIDQRDPDAATITAVLDAIPGAWEQAQEGLSQIRSGQGIRLEEP